MRATNLSAPPPTFSSNPPTACNSFLSCCVPLHARIHTYRLPLPCLLCWVPLPICEPTLAIGFFFILYAHPPFSLALTSHMLVSLCLSNSYLLACILYKPYQIHLPHAARSPTFFACPPTRPAHLLGSSSRSVHCTEKVGMGFCRGRPCQHPCKEIYPLFACIPCQVPTSHYCC